MSGKNQYPVILGPNASLGQTTQPGLSFQSTNPATGFLPLNGNTQGQGSVPSGNPNGAMATTATIYSQILDVSRMDSIGLEIAWSGTPTGTIQVMASNSGINFVALSGFNPAITQPAGSAGATLIDLYLYPFKYVLLVYTNSSGSGTMTAYAQCKDLN